MKVNKNAYIFTTRFVMEEKSPVLYVVHDSYGKWQFFGKEEHFTELDAMSVRMSEALKLDPTLEEIIEKLPISSEASRKGIGGEWKIVYF